MKKTCFMFFILAIIFIAIPIKSNAATFEGITEVKGSTYIVPYGMEIGVNFDEDETIESNNVDICKIDNTEKLQIVGVGKFTLTSKKGDVKNTLNFFAWNVYLREGSYTVYSDVNKSNSCGNIEAKIFFAVSKTSNKDAFKIDEHIFLDGKYTGNNLDGKYITNYYDEDNDISLSRFYEYALDNKFDGDDDASTGEEPAIPGDVDPDAKKIKLGTTYTPQVSENLTWHVVNEDILKIEDKDKGTVRGIRVGTTELIGKTSGGVKKEEIKIYVYRQRGQVINVKKIELDKNSISLKKGETDLIKATVVPNYSDNRKVSWVSSNPSVVGVSIRGRVVARTVGTATITATTANGAKASCKVEVQSKVAKLDWSKAESIKSASRVYNFSDGNIVIASDKSTEINGKSKLRIYTRCSEDGKHWTDSVKASFVDDYSCTNINFHEYNGALYMAYRATGQNVNNSSKFYSGLFVSVSYDKGKTWKYHSKIIEDTRESRSSTSSGVWEPVLGTLNGKLAVFYSNSSSEVNSNHAQKIEYKVFENGSWGERIVAVSGGSSNRPGMPVWKQLSDGTVVIVFENNCKRGSGYTFVIQMVCSLDGGTARNFSNAQDVYVPTRTGRMANSPGLAILPTTRRVVVAFHTSENLSSNSDMGPMTTVNTEVPVETLVARLKENKSIKEYFGNKQNIFNATQPRETAWGALHYGNGYLYASASGHVKRIAID